MAAPASTGMEKADMRKILMQTKEKPVHCAIGVGKDQSIGLMVLDKLKAPKMLEKQLIDSLPDAKNTRFGTAAVDWDNDPKLVKLYLNKPISGMARRLVKTIKGTGFSKVQIMMEDGTPVEGAADEEDEAEAAAGAAAAPQPVANGEAAPDAPPPPPPPPPEVRAPALDAAELTRRLAALAPRIPAAAGDNAERRAELLKLASLGNVNIKTNNLTYAATYIGQLEQALSAPPPPPPPPPAAAAPVQDAAAMARELATLIPRVAQIADPAQKAELAKLANLVNVNIKTSNLTYAATYLAQLRTGLEGGSVPKPAAAPAAPAAPPPDADKLTSFLARLTLKIPSAAEGADALHQQWSGMSDAAFALIGRGDLAAAATAVEQLRVAMAAALKRLQDAAKQTGAYDRQGKAWADARAEVEADLGKLLAAIRDAYKDQPFAAEIESRFSERTAPVLSTLDLGFTDKLAAVAKAADDAKRGQLLDEAHDMLDSYRAYAKGEQLLADLDSNPFVPIAVQAKVLETLDGLEKQLH